MGEVRITAAVARVLRVFLEDPAAAHYGLEIMSSTGLSSGTVYPILFRLAQAGWLSSAWEAIDEAAEGRPPRRCYYIAPAAARQARVKLAEIAQQFQPPRVINKLRPAAQGEL